MANTTKGDSVTSLLDDVDETSSRSMLYARLRQAADLLHKGQDERVGRLQEIEERVRRDYSGAQEALIQVLATSSTTEWQAAVDFLENFEDLLPVALLRVHDGVKSALGQTTTPEEAPF